ncbi:MAG: diadenylate cyclase CdaA [Clostridia bacterium]|nr:diadenylate cyclase CdaA [Clostridia bacterium]
MSTLIDYITRYIQLFRPTDIIDMAIVAILVYNLFRLIRETRAAQLVKGIAILFLILQLSIWFHLTALNYILQAAMQVGMFAIVVIFQPELRSILERMGRSKVGKLMDFAANPISDEVISKTINEIVEATANMSKSKTGALIVLERDTKLGEIMTTGIVLNADVSAGLLENIFSPNTPLHDGAVIIRENKIMNAGCLLPLTSNNNLARELGTRHRAALGISEASDAVVLVVSEETGKISIAVNGTLTRNISGEPLKKALSKTLSKKNPPDALDKIKFWRVINK